MGKLEDNHRPIKQLFNMTVRLSQGEALRLCSNTSDINVIIELSR